MDYQSFINKLNSVMQKHMFIDQIKKFMEDDGRSHNEEISKNSENEHSDENLNSLESCYMDESTNHDEKKNDDTYQNFILEIQKSINDIVDNIKNIIKDLDNSIKLKKHPICRRLIKLSPYDFNWISNGVTVTFKCLLSKHPWIASSSPIIIGFIFNGVASGRCLVFVRSTKWVFKSYCRWRFWRWKNKLSCSFRSR